MESNTCSILDIEHPFGILARMTRTGVRKTRAGLLAALVGAAVLVAGRAAGGPPGTAPGPAPPKRYVVRAGDTLWEIARARVGQASDPRPVVAEIRDLSGLSTSSLRPGQVLLLPPA
jgi:LysM repeat protein